MANAGTEGLDEEEEGIGITVDANLSDAKDVAAGFTLFPETIAGAREKVNFAGALRRLQRFGIHIAKHEHITGFVILNDSGDEPSKFFEREFHDNLPKQKARWGGGRQRVESSLNFSKR
jgi:hypothetical protein